MHRKTAPQGATGDARPQHRRAGTSASANKKAPVGTGRFTELQPTSPSAALPVERAEVATGRVLMMPGWADRRCDWKSTQPTWRQAYPGMRELLRDMRLGSIDLFSPKLALG